MSIFKSIEKEVKVKIEAMQRAGTLPETLQTDKIEATPTRDPAHGDMATNAAMVLAAQLGKNPKEIAALLAESLSSVTGIAKVEIAGPGFINLTLAPSVWQDAIGDILTQGERYGDSSMGAGKKVNIEYVSANPTGPMHVGHGRGAVFGDALATLLVKAGFEVTREYYINDAGAQVDKLADSAHLRYREASGETIEIPEGYYPGDYLVLVGKALLEAHGKTLLTAPRESWLPLVRQATLIAMMQMIKDDLATLGIRHDVFTSERAVIEAGRVEEAMAALDAKGLVYTGVLEPPKGKIPDDWEPRPQTLFRATEFGDDCDRPVKKSDGSWTYFAPDIAYHYDKCQRGFHWLIDVFGADHGGYVKRIKAAVKALSDNKVMVDVKLCQLVKFLRNGEPAKMSKRAGTFVTVREVVEEVGKGVFRFIMLTRKNDAPLDFDFAKVMEQSKDNPVFYVQYAHARAHSAIRHVRSEMPEALEQQPNLSRLNHADELALIRLMCNWPRIIEQAALSLEPHRIAFYLSDLAAAFHGFWNLGNGDLELRFLVKSDIEITAARIALAKAAATVIASGLTVLGVEPMEEMR